MRKVAVVTFSLFLLVGLASAQVPTSGNIFFGYSYESASSSALDFANAGRANLNGWEASLEGKVLPWVGIVADFAGHYGSQSFQFDVGGAPAAVDVDGHEFTVMFGPRISAPIGKFRPFAEFLFGVGHITTTASTPLESDFAQPSDTSFATALGGGIDYKIMKPLALRFQGDYVQTRFFSGTQNDVRLSTGVVFKF